MNPIPSHTFRATAWALPDARRVAQDAIVSHDTTKLQQMLDAEEVDANTRTADGGTLLIEAVRCLNAGAFEALVRDPLRVKVDGADAEGNTVMHHLALRMTDEMLENGWEDMLTTFLDEVSADIDWSLTNRDDHTALELSAEDGRDRIADLLDLYVQDEPGSGHSAHADSYTEEEVFSDVGSEHFENLTPQEQTRVLTLHEQLLQRKRGPYNDR